MKLSKKLKDYLNKNNINYTNYYHNPIFETKELVKNLDLPEKDFTKTNIFQTEDGFVMTVIPIGQKVDLGLFKNASSKTKVKLANLDQINTIFPDCEQGTIPPLGNLFDLPVYVSPALNKCHEIIFHAGTHTETIKMKYEDFQKLVNPKINKISKPAQKSS
ncbi:MAG: aminoacyl-tRNA deacylase [Thermodesulfobacteriota bacterium]